MSLPIPIFVESDPEAIIQEMIAFYEASTGKTLRPAQPEMLVINALAYREFLYRLKTNEAAKQNLVEFSTAPILDYLGQLVGVERLAPSKAVCSILFELVDGHGDMVIPAGLRVASTDGRVVFQTDLATEVLSADNSVTIECTCQSEGAVGNNYFVGTISVIQDPQPYLSLASNTATTSGGGNAETDEQLRARIKLAPSVFSTAGPTDAYKFWAKTASPQIVDVEVESIVPGRVNIYPLMEQGETASEILSAVFDICDNKKVRPLTDTVVVIAPTLVEYTISVDLTLLPTSNQSIEEVLATTKLTTFTENKRKKLGLDIVRSKIVEALASDGLYNVAVTSPSEDLVLAKNEYGECIDININFVGISEQ
jgi:phage-related baseplate assembly protein